jgi:hypothetical protein
VGRKDGQSSPRDHTLPSCVFVPADRRDCNVETADHDRLYVWSSVRAGIFIELGIRERNQEIEA